MALSTYAIGYAAFGKGATEKDNPFSRVGNWHEDWEKGRKHAELDSAKKELKIVPIKLIRTEIPANE